MADVVIGGQVGEQVAAGVGTRFAQGERGEQLVSELHARLYQQNFRGNLFGGGISAITSIANATFTSATTGATATPIIGIWNPLSSPVNVALIQASLGVTLTALQATGPGGFVWLASTGNAAITTGSAPVNRKTLKAGGSFVKDLSGLALTGLTNPLVPLFGSALGGGSPGYAFLATAVAMQTQAPGQVENIDGSIIIPPGAVLALMATTTPVAHSAVSGWLAEEVAF
jgi:hypothetical protein